MSGDRQRSKAKVKHQDLAFRFDPDQMKAFSEASQHFSKRIVEMNSEAFRFINERLNEDLALPSKFAKCRTPADTAKTQLEFFQKMASDYSQEGQKLWALSLDAWNQKGSSSTATKPKPAAVETLGTVEQD